MEYSYQFSEELQQEWDWSERYAAQPEILRYLEHVADRFDLRRDIAFDTRVRRAIFDERDGLWRIEIDRGDRGSRPLLHHGDGLPVLDAHAAASRASSPSQGDDLPHRPLAARAGRLHRAGASA